MFVNAKRYFALALLVALNTILASSAGAQLAAEGNSLYAEGDYAGAVAKYTAAIDGGETGSSTYNNRALAYMRLDSLTNAIEDMATARSKAPLDKRIKLNSAKLEARIFNFSGALTFLDEALTLDGDYVEALFARGWIFEAQNNFGSALAALSEALDIDPEHTESLILTGIIKARQGLDEDAVWWFQRAIASSDQPKKSQLNLLARRNLRALRNGDYEFADPASPGEMRSGIDFLELDRSLNAISLFAAVIEKEPVSPIAWDFLARGYFLASPESSQFADAFAIAQFLLPDATLSNIAPGSSTYIDYGFAGKATGKANLTAFLFPGAYTYIVKTLPYVASVPVVMMETSTSWFVDVVNESQVNLAQIVVTNPPHAQPNQLVANRSYTINAQSLMALRAFWDYGILSQSDLARYNLEIAENEGFFAETESGVAATLTDLSSFVTINDGTANDASPLFSITAKSSLPSSAASIPLRVNWTSSNMIGDFELRINVDVDGDGLSNSDEEDIYGTDPLVADSDEDGLTDSEELTVGSNPLVNDSDDDGDGDGLTFFAEVLIGSSGINSNDPPKIYVDANGGSDVSGSGSPVNPYASLDKAFSDHSGSAVAYVLAPGVYTENETVPAACAIIGSGAEGVNETVIDGLNVGRVLTVPSGGALSLNNLRITRGTAASLGGGISATSADAVHLDGVLMDVNRTSSSHGAAIHFVGNNSDARMRIVRSRFENNGPSSASAWQILAEDCNFSMVNTVVSGAESLDLGVAVVNSKLDLRHCTIGMHINRNMQLSETTGRIANTIIWGSEIDIAFTSIADIGFANSFVGGFLSEDLPGQDPKFVLSDANDLRIDRTSPCIDAADGAFSTDVDIEGQIRWDDPVTSNSGKGTLSFADIGAHELRYFPLSVDPGSVTLDWTAGEQIITVQSTDGQPAAWDFTQIGGASWLTVEQAKINGDGALRLTFGANSSGAQRGGAILVTNQNDSLDVRTVSIFQDGAPRVGALPASAILSYIGGNAYFQINNDGGGVLQWDAEVIEGASFLSVSAAKVIGEGLLRVTYAPSEITTPREGLVRVRNLELPGDTLDIPITQSNAPTLVPSTDSLIVPIDAGQSTITVGSTSGSAIPWSAVIEEGDDWLSIDPQVSLGRIVLIFGSNLTNSNRTASIRLTNLDLPADSRLISITQAGIPQIDVQPRELNLGSNLSVQTISVLNLGAIPLEWSAAVVEGGEWILFQGDGVGSEAGDLQVGILRNTTAMARTGRIEVTQTFDGTVVTVTINQEAGSVNPAELSDLDDSGTVDSVDIQLVINIVLGVSNVTTADVNGDGETNASDIQTVINTVLGVKESF